MLKYILFISLLFFAQSDQIRDLFLMFLKMVKKNPMVASNILKSGYPTIKSMMEKYVGDKPIFNQYLAIVDDIFTKHTEYIDDLCKILYKNAFIIDTFEEIDRMGTNQIIWFINQMTRGVGVKDFVFGLLQQYPNILTIYIQGIAEGKQEEEVIELYKYVKEHQEVYKEIFEIFESLNDREKAIDLITKFREKGLPFVLKELTNLIEKVIS